MNKQVILNEEEFERLIRIAVCATIALDKYTVKENKALGMHIVDTEYVDPNYKELYSFLLCLPDDIKREVVRELPDKYFETYLGEQSVLLEDVMW